MPAPLYKKGDELGEGLHLNRWKVVKKIGEGQFAEVYEVVDAFKENKRCAFKIERTLEAKTVKAEARVLKSLQSCSHVVRLVEQGSIDGRSFMVMELLGMNVSDARRSAASGRWGGDVVKHIGRHMLEAIAGVHKLGFIHRDIKPANFALTPRHVPITEGAWHVLDFGLARKFVDDDGTVIPQRDRKEFRGSTSYASVAAHKLEDLGARLRFSMIVSKTWRRDDLWSWLYVLVEMLDGTLPWRKATADRGATQRLKDECVANPEQLCSQVVMPGPLVTISNHINGLGFEDAPDYGFLHACLDRLSNQPAVLVTSVSAGSLMGSLEDDYPLPAPAYGLPTASAMPARAALATSMQPGSQAPTHTPDSIPSFAMSEPMNGHHRADGGAAMRGHVAGAGFGIGLYPGAMNKGSQPVFIADTPRSPPEEADLLYGDLPGVSNAPPLPAGPPPALLPSPFLPMPMATPVAQSANPSSQAAQTVAARPGASPAMTSLNRSISGTPLAPPSSQQSWPRDGATTVRQSEQGSRETGSPAQRQHRRDDAGRNAEEPSHKRRASSRSDWDGAADDRWWPPDKRRDIDGDITRRDVQSDPSRDAVRGDRQRDMRRRGDTRTSEQPSRPPSRSRHAPESSRIRDMVDNVRRNDVSKRVWECYDALRAIEDLEAGIGVLGAFVQRWVDNVSPENCSDGLRVLDEFKAFVTAEQDRCRKGSMK